VRDDQHLDVCAFTFLGKQELMPQVTGQAVRIIDDGGGKRLRLDQLPQPTQSWAVHRRARDALIDQHM